MNFIASSGTVTDCMIMDNVGTVGGIGSDGPGDLVITDCTIIRNEGKFGGIYGLASSNFTVTNSIISNNYGPEAAGGVTLVDSDATLTNCTITDNAGPGNVGGIKCINTSSLTATNCILWGNTPDNQIVDCTSTVTYSDVEGGHSGEGNINADPMLETVLYDYHLTGVSPCIDAGTSEGAPDRDIEGTVRPQINGYDMGAYEYLADNDGDGVPDYFEMGPDPENLDPTYERHPRFPAGQCVLHPHH
ncbi:MAG: right-handed parallel beta-helix repeat-containing protein [Deltaproteobacteria bacterium]|nr:right-handed parallel beta-helix repeat-containing protein [Deltaproteobacteria bacterium]